MKLEPDLADRLRAEADRLEVSGPPTTGITRRGRRRSRLRTGAKGLSVIALVAVSAALGLIVTGEDSPNRLAGPRELAQDPEREGAYENYPRLSGDDPVPQPSPVTPGGGGEPGSGGGSDFTFKVSSDAAVNSIVVEPESPVGSGRSLVSPKVIKTARLRIEVGEDSLGASFAEVERLAARYGGFVSDSATTSNPARSGEMTIRLPSPAFESAVADLKSLGQVEAQRVSGVDVTAEFVDLEARLRNWEAQERVLVRLMGEANTIAESLQVQRELQGVRLQIEQIHGQLRVLRDQTSLGTISLLLHEPGAAEEPSEDSGLGGAWGRAVSAAGDVVAAMVVGLGYLLPILGALIVLWFGVRAVRSRRPA